MHARAAILLVLLVAPAVALASVSEERQLIVTRALDLVAGHQGADGRWPLSSQGYPTEAAASAGIDPAVWPSRTKSALASLTPEPCTQPAVPEHQQPCYRTTLRVVHAAASAGYDPRALPGFDGVARVRAGFVGGQFGDPRLVNDDVWAVLALRAAGVPADDPMVRAGVETIWAARTPDGGWSDTMLATRGNTDMTAMALVALAAAGERVRGDAAATRALNARWETSGAFSDGFIGPNVQSTVWALHAMHVLGVPDNGTAIEFILSEQRGDGSIGSGLWSTTEAIVALAGARYPLPSFAPIDITSPQGHAREPIRLVAGAQYARATWTFDDGVVVHGPVAERTFDAAGRYAFALVAESATLRSRASGNVTVLSARPWLPTFPALVHADRHANVTLDLSNASDPDGRIVEFEIDWGDGNVTNTTTHAYLAPAERTVRVRAKDDAGVWSAPASFVVAVRNRPPDAPALPARIVADRIAGVALVVNASDPDGDAVALRWTFGDRAGAGAPRFLPGEIGERTLRVVARDAFGAEATSEVRVDVVNTPPVVALALPEPMVAGVEISLEAHATDPDGAPPTLAWWVDGLLLDTPRFTFPDGAHDVLVVATDADGANASARARFVVGAPRERSPAPEIVDLDASLSEVGLVVWFNATPPDATMRLVWRSNGGEGRTEATSPFQIALTDATWAIVSLDVEHGGEIAKRETGLLLAPVTPAPARFVGSPPAPVEVRPEVAAPRSEGVPRESALEPAALTQVAPPPRETPLPWTWVLAALALAMLGRRARSA